MQKLHRELEQEMSLVDVIIITYNQEKLIEQALMSILSQKTDKIANIYVFNDHSTDNTGNIIEDLRRKYPGRITHIFHSHNFGMNRNFHYAIMYCKSRYVAILEGDDFWCDENKIERQLAIMENNRHFVACAHPIKVVDEFGSDLNQIYPKIDVSSMDIFDPIKILPNYYPGFHINTILARTKILQKCFIKEFDDLSIGDLPMNYLLIQKGKIAYIAKSMSVWRQSTTSYFNGQSALLKIVQSINANEKLRPYLRKELREIQWQMLLKTVKLFDNEFRNAQSNSVNLADIEKATYVFNCKIVKWILQPHKYPDKYGRFSLKSYISANFKIFADSVKTFANDLNLQFIQFKNLIAGFSLKSYISANFNIFINYIKSRANQINLQFIRFKNFIIRVISFFTILRFKILVKSLLMSLYIKFYRFFVNY